MNILMLSATFPYPPSRGGTQVRTFNLLKFLQSRHAITLVTQAGSDVTEAEIAELRRWVSALKVFPKSTESAQGNILGKAARFSQFVLEGTPPSVRHSYSQAMQQWIDAQAATQNFEIVTCEHSVNERYVSRTVQQHIPCRVVNIHSSVYGTCRQQLATGTTENSWRDRLSLPLLKRYEGQYCRKFSDLVVTTPEDAEQISNLCPQKPVHVVTNGVDLEMFPLRPCDPGGYRLVFIGAMDNLANIDAVKFLSQQVFPPVRSRYPEATLALVGARPTPEVLALGKQPGVTVTGKVPSMVTYLHQATVSVISMRTGYGIKNKTLEAMAAGTPVVASDYGLEGLTVDGANVPLRALRANQPEAFMAAIERLFEDATLRQTLSHNARTMIESDYTWERAGQRYHQVFSA